MTLRERNMLVLLVGVGSVFVLGLLFHTWFWTPLQNYGRTIDELEGEIADKDKLIRVVQLEKKRLEKYRVLSLASSPEVASSEYAMWLRPVLQMCGLREIELQPPAATALKPPPASQQGKKAGHMVLSYGVRARGDMAAVVRTLDALKRAPILHRVKSLTVAVGDDKSSGRLNLTMTIEAMIVNKAEATQPFLSAPDGRLVALETIAGLRRAPIGMALAPWLAAKTAVRQQVAGEQLARNYSDIPLKNPFLGAPLIFEEDDSDDLDMREFIYLNHTNPGTKEAYLLNRVVKSRETRLRAVPGSGYDTFRVMNESGTKQLVRGKVLRVDQRDVYFQVEDYIFGLHIGQSLADAMKRPLTEGQAEDLELTALFDAEFAQESVAPGKAAKGGRTPTKGGKKGPGKRMTP
jgi:hypothetical protein